MFSVIEKIKFIVSTRFNTRLQQKAYRKKQSNENLFSRILKKLVKIVVVVFVMLTALGLFLYFFTAPTIIMPDSSNKVIHADRSPYTAQGYLSSGSDSSLKINGYDVEVVGSDFAHKVNLDEGDNRFVFEASNSHGVTKEIYVIRFAPQPGTEEVQ